MLYNIAADSFYIMKLCSRLFVLHCRSLPKYDTSRHFDPHFEEVAGGVEPWWMARWKARAEFLLSVTQPPTPSGTVNGNLSRCSDALWPGSKGRYDSFHLWINVWVAGKTM